MVWGLICVCGRTRAGMCTVGQSLLGLWSDHTSVVCIPCALAEDACLTSHLRGGGVIRDTNTYCHPHSRPSSSRPLFDPQG